MNIFKLILDLIFPSRCMLCGCKCKAGAFLCENCPLPDEPQVRMFNLKPGVRGVNSHILKVFSPTVYTDFYRKSLHLYKFRQKTAFAESYAKFIFDMKLMPEDTDIITYVPMTEKKIRERGYNQSELIAKNLSKISGVPYTALLIKSHENKLQHTLSINERKENVKGVFTATGDIKGQNIVLVDDIITTGATMCECAGVLYRGKAKSVAGICAADAQTKNKSEHKYQRLFEENKENSK